MTQKIECKHEYITGITQYKSGEPVSIVTCDDCGIDINKLNKEKEFSE